MDTSHFVAGVIFLSFEIIFAPIYGRLIYVLLTRVHYRKHEVFRIVALIGIVQMLCVPATISGGKMQIQNLAINAFLYFMSSVLCDFLIRAMRAADISLRVVSDTESYAVIPGLISYSANYYVYFWRSREHRRAFQNQLKCGFALKRSGKLFIVTRSSMANIKFQRMSFFILTVNFVLLYISPQNSSQKEELFSSASEEMTTQFVLSRQDKPGLDELPWGQIRL
ncbi:hypothetical protein L596_019385 [Steinernema carpocapsae]|uniref:Uncharacterized protein n=1 Tax=Steinernema carpocapsae TaxID=34508 RepID=A0A4U5MQW8_STECR|nr:hypothetical protein L596_019385 [Steinernema carpocapsae]